MHDAELEIKPRLLLSAHKQSHSYRSRSVHVLDREAQSCACQKEAFQDSSSKEASLHLLKQTRPQGSTVICPYQLTQSVPPNLLPPEIFEHDLAVTIQEAPAQGVMLPEEGTRRNVWGWKQEYALPKAGSDTFVCCMVKNPSHYLRKAELKVVSFLPPAGPGIKRRSGQG